MIKQVQALVLCDDVRTEADTDKQILIGTYGTEITVHSRPAIMNLKLFIMAELDGSATDIDLEVTFNRVRIENIKVPAGFFSAQGNLPLNILMSEDRTLSVRYRFDGRKWSKPYSWRFSFADNAADAPPEVAEALNRGIESARALVG